MRKRFRSLGKRVASVGLASALILSNFPSSFVVHATTSTPTLSITDIKSYASGSNVYLKSENEIKFKVTGVAVSSISLLKDGEAVPDGVILESESTSSGSFDVTESGVYTVEVVDTSGSKSVFNLSDCISNGKTNIIIDVGNPTLNSFKYGNVEVGLNSYYKKLESNILKVNVSDDTLVSKVTYSINNGNVTTVDNINSSSKDIEINLNDLTNSLDIAIDIVDVLGNTTNINKAINIDGEGPIIPQNLLQGSYMSSEGTDSYIVGVKASLNGVITDTLSGVSSTTVNKVNNGVSKEVFKGTDNINVVITESGEYVIKSVDNVGNESTSTINIVGIDDIKPNIARLDEELNAQGVWYESSKGFVEYTITDTNLKEVTAKVNNEDVVIRNEGSNYTVNVDDTKSGQYAVCVTASDKLNNISTNSYIYGVDKEKVILEEISAKLLIDGVLFDKNSASLGHKNTSKGFYSNIKPELIIGLNNKDSGLGASLYKLYKKSDEGVYTLSTSNSEGKFTLDSGEYGVSVVDYLNRESDIFSLKEVLKLESSKIIVDTELPKIDYKKSKNSDNSWYSEDITYEIKGTDTVGLYKVTIQINDSMSANIDTSQKVVNSLIVTKSTKDVTTANRNKYDVTVKAEDFAGNVATWKDVIFIDKEAPKLVSASLTNSYINNDNSGVYFKEKPKLDVKATDVGIGLESISIVNSRGNVLQSNTNGLFELDEGDYGSCHLELKDKLGNTFKSNCLREVLNLNNDNFYIDNTIPELSCDRPEGSINGWYKDDIEFVATVKDNVGIASIEAIINGVKVSDFKSKGVKPKEYIIKASTKGVDCKEDGSYDIEIKSEDSTKGSATFKDTIYIDRQAPTIDNFVINNPTYSEGSYTGSKYGYYFNGDSSVDVYVSDGDISVGLDNIKYIMASSNGKTKEDTVKLENGVANIVIPSDFKGYLKVSALDKLGNESSLITPDGFVSETSNTHINTSNIKIGLDKTEHKDIKGNSLYSKDVPIVFDISDSHSGIRSFSWGINDETLEELSVDNNGVVSGNINSSITSKDNNLVTGLRCNALVKGNSNDIRIWVKVVDRVGHVSNSSRVISIDKDTPKIDVAYNVSKGTNYYNETRKATVTITDTNFYPNGVEFKGSLGSIGNWVSKGNGTWSTEVVFTKDGNYSWSLNCHDLAGNKAIGYNSESFTIDKKNPKLSVTFDNNNSSNGNYYNGSRVATVSIIEKNFSPSLVKYKGDGKLGNWSSSGDVHTCRVTFDRDGRYNFNVGVLDKAGNTTNSFNSNEFVIDKSTPTLSIEGVQDGVSYKKNISLVVSSTDENIDKNRSKVELIGRTNGLVGLSGGFTDKSGAFSLKGFSDKKESDDLYTLKAIIYDKAGNSIEEELVFSVNRFGSSYKFLETHLLGNIVSKGEVVNLKETSVDRLDMTKTKVSIIKDGKELDVSKRDIGINETGGTDGPWVYTYKVNKSVFNGDGKYQVQVYSETIDGSENNSLSEEYAFMLDSTNPEVIVSGVKEDEIYDEVAKKVSIEIRDLSGEDRVDVLLNGSKVNLNKENDVYTLTIDELSERQDLNITVVDKAGNTTEVAVEDFLITTSTLVSLMNRPFVLVGLVILLAGVSLGVLYIVFKLKNKKN